MLRRVEALPSGWSAALDFRRLTRDLHQHEPAAVAGLRKQVSTLSRSRSSSRTSVWSSAARIVSLSIPSACAVMRSVDDVPPAA